MLGRREDTGALHRIEIERFTGTLESFFGTDGVLDGHNSHDNSLPKELKLAPR